mmetsp:Transcript_48954/g.141833  ORF Transcript_48954/g.141833 Transcript_48954/m.141833 type:complete len:679 (+) Transcript_48954:70-2106(+)
MVMAEQIPGLDEFLQQLDAQGDKDGAGVEDVPKASEAVDTDTGPRQPPWSHELFVGYGKFQFAPDGRDRCEESYQECDTLADLKPRTRLGKAPYKQQAEEKALPRTGAEQVAYLLSGGAAKRHAAGLAVPSAPPVRAPSTPGQRPHEGPAKPHCPWRISEDLALAGQSKPSEALPGLSGLRRKGARTKDTPKGEGGDGPSLPPRKEPAPQLAWRRRPKAQATDGELLALLGGAAWSGRPGDGPGDDERGSPLERRPLRCSATDSKAKYLTVSCQRHDWIGGVRYDGKDQPEDEAPDAEGTDDEVAEEEAEPDPLPPLEELLKHSDIYKQGSFKIAGTWDSWQHNDMIWMGNKFVYFVPLEDKAWQSFQILHEGDWRRTLYPSIAHANPFEKHSVMGPDDKGHGHNWTIGRHASDRGPPGTFYKVELIFDEPSDPVLVRWESAGPEAAVRRAKQAALQEAALAAEQWEREEEEDFDRLDALVGRSRRRRRFALPPEEEPEGAAALPPPALRPLDGLWDGVPVNLGQAYDVGPAFTISVEMRTRMPGLHEEQGGRILAKRKGRSGWELVVPRRETGGVSFYCSAGGHLDIGPTRVDDGKWHHIVVTFDQQGEMRSYVDGRFDGAVGHIVRPQPEAELWLGTRTQSSGLFLGDLLDLQVFDCALAEEEAELLAQAASCRKG